MPRIVSMASLVAISMARSWGSSVDVVEFTSASLAHADDRKTGVLHVFAFEVPEAQPLGGERAACNSERSLQRCRRQVGQYCRDAVETGGRVFLLQIEGRDPREHAAVAHAQARPRRFAALRREAVGGIH
jgi:hypothetical protein